MRLLIVSLAFLIIPFTASAQIHRHHHNTTPPPVTNPTPPPTPPTVTTTSGTCINYGYQPLTNGQYDMTQVNADLAKLKAAHINCLRLAFYGTNSGTTKPLATVAKQAGFYVIIGNDGDPTSANYSQGVIAEATWAQANKIDQVSIGNEAEGGGTNKTIENALTTLSCQVRKVYSGVISYDSEPFAVNANGWNTGSLACIDKIGINVYADPKGFSDIAQKYLPGHWYYSETNIDCDYNNQCGNDANWATGLNNFLTIEKTYNVPIYVFSYNAGGDGVNLHWQISTHPQVAAILGL